MFDDPGNVMYEQTLVSKNTDVCIDNAWAWLCCDSLMQLQHFVLCFSWIGHW